MIKRAFVGLLREPEVPLELPTHLKILHSVSGPEEHKRPNPPPGPPWNAGTRTNQDLQGHLSQQNTRGRGKQRPGGVLVVSVLLDPGGVFFFWRSS